MKQLQVLFEKRRGPERPAYYHWITAKALYRLEEEQAIASEIVVSNRGTRVRLFFHRSHRYWRRQAVKLLGVIDEMSDPNLAEACGEHADVLFFNALMARGFVAYGQDINEYRGRMWKESDHDLDFVIERDAVAYGCEVKNKWDYIERDELRTKIRMCHHLGVRPLFITRASPTSYNYDIIEAGGYSMIYVSHLYPFGFKGFAERIERELGMPADSPRSVPAGIIDRFLRWHLRHPR